MAHAEADRKRRDDTVRLLSDAGVSYRDIAELLGLSHQRVAQIARRVIRSPVRSRRARAPTTKTAHGRAGYATRGATVTGMASVAPARHRFSVEEYHRMGEAGLFGEDDRVELLEGEIVDMAPIGSRHAACVNRINRLFVTRLGERAIVQVQSSIRLGDFSEPQPDIAVLRPRADFYESALPRAADVLLLVEVADSTVGWDRAVKAPLYARAGVAETWVVDLEEGTVEVYRSPGPDGYAEIHQAARGEELDAAGVRVRVDEILG